MAGCGINYERDEAKPEKEISSGESDAVSGHFTYKYFSDNFYFKES